MNIGVYIIIIVACLIAIIAIINILTHGGNLNIKAPFGELIINKDKKEQKNNDELNKIVKESSEEIKKLNDIIKNQNEYFISIVEELKFSKNESEEDKLLIKELNEKNNYYKKEIEKLNIALNVYADKEKIKLLLKELMNELDITLSGILKKVCLQNHLNQKEDFDGYINNKFNEIISIFLEKILVWRVESKKIFLLDKEVLIDLITIDLKNDMMSTITELFYVLKNIITELERNPIFIDSNKKVEEESKKIVFSVYKDILTIIEQNRKLSPVDITKKIIAKDIIKTKIKEIINLNSCFVESYKLAIVDKQMNVSGIYINTIIYYIEFKIKETIVETLQKERGF